MEWMPGLALAGTMVWLVVLILPWRPWSVRESLDSHGDSTTEDLSDIVVLIPARNEAAVITQTLDALTRQGKGLRIIVIDDQSTDGTADIVSRLSIPEITLVYGKTPMTGWNGKLWALEQGWLQIENRKDKFVLLLDADIELTPGLIATLKQKLEREQLHLLSLMARLRMESLWERLLVPSFVYFFKLLYPFHLSNRHHPWVAAAAGGCVIFKGHCLESIGGFAAIKGALIDDCALAKKFRQKNYRTWIGLTHSANSLRAYNNLADIWHMVTRTAFTQLRCSYSLLLLCVVLMTLAFVLPVIILLSGNNPSYLISASTLLLMVITYVPVLRYYQLPWGWLPTLPLAGIAYLLMTCDSALRHTKGIGTSWKDRIYKGSPTM